MLGYDSYEHTWGKNIACDRVYSLVCGLSPEKRKNRVFMVLQAYFDESDKRIEGGGTFVLAGYVAPAEKWLKFTSDWDGLLKEKGMDVFSWIKMRRRLKDNELFYREIEKHVDHCVYSITDIGALHKAVDDFKWPDVFLDPERMKRTLRNPYHLAVKHLLLVLTEQKPTMELSGPIDLFFDEKTAVFGAFDYLKFTAPDSLKKELGGLSFFPEEEMLPLQSADLYAGWVRKSHMEGKNLRTGHPFPWAMNKPMRGLYMYQNYDFFMREFEAICDDDNLETFREYVKTLERPLWI